MIPKDLEYLLNVDYKIAYRLDPSISYLKFRNGIMVSALTWFKEDAYTKIDDVIFVSPKTYAHIIKLLAAGKAFDDTLDEVLDE